jgi:predicted nuclease of predicted toxin-antitoxin system
MQFLNDESCDFAFVRALREAGHDVLLVGEITPRADDSDVIHLAQEQNRILLTEDKDFGQLVFASGTPSVGVIFFRYPVIARQSVLESFMELVREKGEQLHQFFTVVEPGRVRIKPRPDLSA